MTTIQPGTFQHILSGPMSGYLSATDPDAHTLRQSLGALGFNYANLEDAVRAFQLRHNAEHPECPIKVDGKAGSQTLNALYAGPIGGPGLQDSLFGRAKFLRAKDDVALLALSSPYSGAKKRVQPAYVGDTKPEGSVTPGVNPKDTAARLDRALNQQTSVQAGAEDFGGIPLDDLPKAMRDGERGFGPEVLDVNGRPTDASSEGTRRKADNLENFGGIPLDDLPKAMRDGKRRFGPEVLDVNGRPTNPTSEGTRRKADNLENLEGIPV